jgi:hypothetical protein
LTGQVRLTELQSISAGAVSSNPALSVLTFAICHWTTGTGDIQVPHLLLVLRAIHLYLELWDIFFPPPTSVPSLLAHTFSVQTIILSSRSSYQGALPMQPSVDSACSGFSRRSFLRFAASASALASMPILTEARLAWAERPKFADPNKGIHIDANENPLGPSEGARQAIADIIPKGGRYEFLMQEELAEIFAKIEGLNPESVMPFAGSSEPLHYTGCGRVRSAGNQGPAV